MNKVDRIKNTIRDVTSEELFGILATSVNDVPYTTLIAFALEDDLSKLFFATSRDTKKFKQLKINGKISFHINNSRNSPKDIGNAVSITISGSASECPKENFDKAMKLYLSKNPQMTEFINGPNTALISVHIERYDIVERFQNVTVLNMEEQVTEL
jgi:nitroimidazol reductase NimA-like FMN-containing flavoprotein (pyridoxamine 5'-phosphate oxidase superfamily)